MTRLLLALTLSLGLSTTALARDKVTQAVAIEHLQAAADEAGVTEAIDWEKALAKLRKKQAKQAEQEAATEAAYQAAIKAADNLARKQSQELHQELEKREGEFLEQLHEQEAKGMISLGKPKK